MFKDKFKVDIAEKTAQAFRDVFPDLFISRPDLYIFDPDRLSERLETPKNPEMGNYALPLFDIAKILKGNPVEINKRLAETQNSRTLHPHLVFTAVGGFNNARIKTETLARDTLTTILEDEQDFGTSTEGQGKNIVIDFSSPNIAKPFGVGHLRTTAIGHSLYRIFEKLGYNSIGINHLGDWGTQFGKMIVAFRKWGSDDDLKTDPISKLYNLYVRFHQEEEKDPNLSEEAREAFRKLEQGGHDEAELWNKFKEYSLNAVKKTYETLGVHFDHYTGESFYNDKITPVIARLRSSGLTKFSQDALIVDLEEYNIPACILSKADGATLYATRDIAGVLYRWETFQFEKALYVVAASQKDHFKQVFKVIELLEEREKIPASKRCSGRLVHVDFGWIKFRDEMMSTRKGTIIFLDDVIEKATELARSKILEKNPDLKEIDKTARQIGIGAILFADMSTRRQKDVNFDWDDVLNFEGETGPYLQYTHARLASLLRHYEKKVSPEIDFSLLDHPEEYRVLDLLYKFPAAVCQAAETYEPYVISTYLIELASAFNKVYQRKDDSGRIDKIISDDAVLSQARMALVNCVKIVIKEGLYLLGIEAPDEM
ncbi:MAG: arginine--tRNA ligase [Candidatus Zixiibacteriota bacterium]|nr:MAG: arginine--tRNA ligase [candidate division Zixibacteria bacterium]